MRLMSTQCPMNGQALQVRLESGIMHTFDEKSSPLLSRPLPNVARHTGIGAGYIGGYNLFFVWF